MNTMFKHLLIPIDGSELSLMAVRKGAEFASEIRALVTLLFVKPEYPVSYYGDGAMIDPTTPEEFSKLTNTIAFMGTNHLICTKLTND